MDRRAFLRTVGTTAAATAVISPEVMARNAETGERLAATPQAVKALGNRNRLGIQSDLTAWSPGSPGAGNWDATTIGHLYRRAGFGATLSEMAAAQTKTYDKVVDALLDDTLLTGSNIPAPPSTAPNDWFTKAPYLGNTLSELQKQQSLYASAMQDIRAQWTQQMSQPATMLRERMVLFWMNHFVVEEQKVYYPQLMYRHIDYFRKNAWGDFKQMVKDVTISPAMLIYLDGQYNAGSSPNENYARELQELFTMGVYDKDGNANYSQADVEGIAHALTGWTVDNTAPSPNVLPAKYNIPLHDSSFQKIYDGASRQYNLTASGASMDMDLIDHVFDQRGNQIAWYICSKLYQYFVYHQITTDAEKAIVQQLADTLKANWKIKDVLALLLKSEHFFDSANIGAAIKSPYDHLVPMVRQFDIVVDQLTGATPYYYTYAQAQILLDPPNVKGWLGYHNWMSTTTLPGRNAVSTMLLLSTNHTLQGYGSDANGNAYKSINLTDAQMLAWGKQFTNFNGQFIDMLTEVATFLCAQPLGPALLDPNNGYLVKQFVSNISYEWSNAADADKVGPLRQMANAIMQLAEYQLY